MRSLIKQFKARPLLNIFFIVCLIITTFFVSIINSIIDRAELKIREGNIGYSYNNVSEFAVDVNDANPVGKANLNELEKNEYYKKYDSLSIMPIQNDKYSFTLALVNARFNYLDKLVILKALDISDMNNSVAIGVKTYNRLGHPKTIKIFNKEYKISHILGSNTEKTAFDDFVVLNNKILSEQDKENFIMPITSVLIKFLNAGSSDSAADKIILSFNGSLTKNRLGIKSTFILDKFDTEKNSEVAEAYNQEKDNIANKNLLIIIGICNIVIVSTFWILDRKKEIAIRKAFGTNKIRIMLMIFKEILALSVFSGILTIILQFIFMNAGGKLLKLNIEPSFTNIIAVSGAAFIIAIIASIIPAINALRIQISECLKS